MTPTQVRGLVYAAGGAAGLEKQPSPHRFPPCPCAPHTLERGAPIELVQATFGHA